MNIIYVRSKMQEKDLKQYLLFEQFYGKSFYIPLRAILAVAIGAIVGIFSPQHLTTFLMITAICLVVLLLFPRMRVGFKAPQIYRRNRSGAFHQSQDFALGETRLGFKSESEEEYDWTNYSALQRAIETKTLFIFEYSPQQRTILVRSCMEEEDQEMLRDILSEQMGDRFVTLKRL